MGKRLSDNLTSKYFEAANRLTSKKARRRIVAYVESYDDVFFWRTVLSRFENESQYFQVMLPSRFDHLERGKKAVMMRLLSQQVGHDMIACVDADYDYLMQGATETSREVLSNPYVFHTYAYAIENLQCYAPSLYEVCVATTLNDHAIFNIDEYLRQYSLAIFPLFVWSIWYYRSPNYKDFTISDFNRVIETGNFNIQNAERLIQNVRRKVGSRIRQLQLANPNAKESYLAVKEDIKRLGVTPETTYLYIQGHNFFDKIVVPMMKKICDQLIRERQSEINRQSMHGTQRRNELSCYSKSTEDIRSMLKKNLGYMTAEPFRRIQADIQRFLDEDNASAASHEQQEQPDPSAHEAYQEFTAY